MSDSHGARSIFSGDGDGTAIYASINVKPEGGGGPRAYVGHLTFQENFWSKSPPWGPAILVKSDQISPLSQWIENI